LEGVKAHFVHRENLSELIEKISRRSRDYNLEILDFSPVIDSYFSNSEEGIIKILPLAVTVKGQYLQIGKFIENFDKLDFYLIPQKILIEVLNSEKNILSATVTCNLYTWNN
jgi:Tfp pilus assembly protein PilO